MKYIFVFIVIALCSCKSKEELTHEKLAGIYRADSIEHSEIFPSGQPYVANTPDTSIGQQVWYYKDQYVLQTWVNTSKYQFHVSPHRDGNLIDINANGGAPYNVDIIGSFEYIRSNKHIEYQKAVKALDSLRIQGYAIQMKNSVEERKQKAINDSIEILKKF